MNYVYSLRFGEKPDYNYLKSLLARLLFSYYIAKFYFDWNLLQPKEVPGNLRINKEIDNKYLFKTDSDNKNGALSLVSSVNHHNRNNDDSNEEDEEEEDEESDDDDKSSNDNGSKGKEEMCNDNNKQNIDEESSVLISSSNMHNSNKERNEESDDDDGTNKTEQNSFFNDEEFLEMFTEINRAPKGRKVAPKYAGIAPLNINLKNINNQNTPFNHNLHIKKKQNNNNNNTNYNSINNGNSSSQINNTNTNDDLLLKSSRSGVSLASLSSDRNLLHNNNNNNTGNTKHKGKLIKLNQQINDNIREEDEDGTTSKR